MMKILYLQKTLKTNLIYFWCFFLEENLFFVVNFAMLTLILKFLNL